VVLVAVEALAVFADECQSFLDNVIAGLGRIGSWNIGSQGRPGRSVTARIYEFAMDSRSWRRRRSRLEMPVIGVSSGDLVAAFQFDLRAGGGKVGI
jgi:hypothetical protein